MPGLIKPLLSKPLKHLYRLCSDKMYFKYNLLESCLRRKSRYIPCSANLFGKPFAIADNASFLSAFYEIFVQRIYEFSINTPSPKILDLGANIGLSVLFFKRLFPASHVTAYEADPSIFQILQQNVNEYDFGNVHLFNKAAWSEDGTIAFQSEGADAGHIIPEHANNTVNVESEDIRKILTSQTYDFIKMDIEGAENTLIPMCRGLLGKSRYLFIEYHACPNQRQHLDEIISTLAHDGFSVDIQNPNIMPVPFKRNHDNQLFDVQLNIFAWKQD